MVRLTQIPEVERKHLLAKRCPVLGRAFTAPPALERARVALVTTAGIGLASDAVFEFGDVDWRALPDKVTGAELVMSHASVNYDRSGFYQDINVVFPIDRLHALVDSGDVGSAAATHYAFMGALSEPEAWEDSAREAAQLMQRDGVDVVVLSPV